VILFLFFFSFLLSQEDLVDGVLAVVENKHILFSEVLGESRVVAEQRGINPQSSPLLFQQVFDSVLKDKIYLQVVLLSAEKDTLIEVSYDEISRSLDERISLFSSQLGSVQDLEAAFGLSLGDIKNNYWETVREELLIDKYKFLLLGNVSITKNEVLSFYESFRDSLPVFPEKASFSLIEKSIAPSSSSIKKIKEKLSSIKDSVSLGLASFDYFVKKHSEDPSVKDNAGIMQTIRGDLVLDYEKLAYSLEPGSLGGPIQTSFGYHLIMLLDRVGEKITTQHLLLTAPPSSLDSLVCVSYLDSLLSFSNNDPGLFDSLAVTHKTKKENLSGYYREVELSSFPPAISSVIKDLNNYSFSSVFGDSRSLYVLYKYNYLSSSDRDLTNSWSFIENIALNKKRGDVFNVWIEDQIEKTYVKINSVY
tara:strand:- start:387 stop:1649 length:1263 start_codon:yes stop_codon:yes gene_type:complete